MVRACPRDADEDEDTSEEFEVLEDEVRPSYQSTWDHSIPTLPTWNPDDNYNERNIATNFDDLNNVLPQNYITPSKFLGETKRTKFKRICESRVNKGI